MSETGKVRSIEELLQVMRELRNPVSGCAWDIEQDFRSIAPYTIEEAYEVADAIDRGDLDDLCGELGDLLFQVAFHAQMAEEMGVFGFADVVTSIVDKMIRRHPHVFGDRQFASTAELKVHWETLKEAERQQKAAQASPAATVEHAGTGGFPAAGPYAGDASGVSAEAVAANLSALDGVARNLPALIRAEKIQKRAARVGFDWPTTPPVFAKVLEELDEVREAVSDGDAGAVRDEIGDLLFAAVNLARHHQVDAETALREATQKFDRRFRAVEQLAAERGLDLRALDLEGLDGLWETVKRRQ